LRNLKATIAYEGTNYYGWQYQPNLPTVQGTIEKALYSVTGEKISVIGAGRTDAGVHALGQVASFKTNKNIDDFSLKIALNSLLPPDIRILAIEPALPDFHSRFSAKAKEYRYQVHRGEVVLPFEYRYFWQVNAPLDIKAMREAGNYFVGEKDFTAFQAGDARERNPIRRILSFEMEEKGEILLLRVKAESFLKYMVRRMVGLLIEVGLGKKVLSDIIDIIETKDQELVRKLAPPRGLFLVKVEY
jgi:tRNA pseudouridine38-40 synthase